MAYMNVDPNQYMAMNKMMPPAMPSGDMGNYYQAMPAPSPPQMAQSYSMMPQPQVNSYPTNVQPRFPHTQTTPMTNQYQPQNFAIPNQNVSNYNQMMPFAPQPNMQNYNMPPSDQQINYPQPIWNNQMDYMQTPQPSNTPPPPQTENTAPPNQKPVLAEEMKFSQYPPEFIYPKPTPPAPVKMSPKSRRAPNPKPSNRYVFREPLLPARNMETKRPASKNKLGLSKQAKSWELRGSKYYGCFTSRTNGLQDICPKAKCQVCDTPPKSAKSNTK